MASTSLALEIITLLMNARNLNNTAMSITDRRAPGVSAALRSRIGTLLGSGATVSLRRDNLVLRDIVLTRQHLGHWSVGLGPLSAKPK